MVPPSEGERGETGEGGGGAVKTQQTITTAHGDRECTFLRTNGSVPPVVMEISPGAASMCSSTLLMFNSASNYV